MTIADGGYTPKLAFVFLNEVAEAFMDELRNKYGTAGNIDYGSKLETIENMYSFNGFGKSCKHCLSVTGWLTVLFVYKQTE